ncbi:hypothetical protein NE237_024756 [Protea cynaroides]|uniref:Pirin n=1 Tax=Protea cynaroides TaxID=273540 RepID=A0A9Q0H1R8_9MAGN|nr:hypothetical protein NE237_024756 [Protea cynaroides]
MRTINYRLLFNLSPIKTKTNFVVSSLIKKMSTEHQTSGISKHRLVVKKLLAQPKNEGKGAFVRRSIGSMELRRFDPFLLLDEFSVTPPAGFPDHPHRGFETVTYMLEGAVTHQDFSGSKGTIRTGDVQWMTAGRGIIHSEMPAEGGPNRGLQLWINLSSEDKMIEPRYQDLLREEIKRAEKDGVEVRIIAGESMGVKSPVFTRTPAMYLDVIMKAGAEWHQSIPESWNSFVYVLEGEGVFGSLKSSTATAHHLLLLGPGDDGLSVWNNSTEPLRFVLIAGQPLHEPVVQYGPFVMNTQAEIQKTFEDYRFHRNGFEKAKYWRSQPVSR